jgi:hypothetical protein
MDSERTHPFYEPPEIIDLGPVEDLTQGTTFGPGDNNEGSTAPTL